MNLRQLINLFTEQATTPRQGTVGADLARTSGGQFTSRADRTNQAKVDAALGPGFKAGSKEANLALQQKFKQPGQQPPVASGDQTAGGKTNADFLPGVAGGAKTPSADSAPAAVSATTSPPPNVNALGVTTQAGNVFGQPAPTPDKPDTRTGSVTPDSSATVQAAPPAVAPPAPPADKKPQYGGGYDPNKVDYQYKGGQKNPMYTSGAGDAAFVTMNNPTAKAAQPPKAGPMQPNIIPPEFAGLPANIGNMSPADAATEYNAAMAGTGKELAPGQQLAGTGSGGTLISGSGKPVQQRDFNKPQFGSMGNRLNEIDSEDTEKTMEEELEEAFNDMLRLSGIKLDEKAPPGAKAERMVKHIKKGYAKDGKLTDTEKRKAFGATWKAYNAGKLDEGLNLMLDEDGHTLEHIVNRFKHEAKTFLNTGEMSDKLYDALYDYYVDRGEMPYGIAKAREGDPYTWVAARFEADIDGTVDVKMPLGEVGGDDTLNELARLAGLSESRAKQDVAEDQINECGDMGMNSEDRLNVSTNMSSDGTKSVNISAQGDKAEELLSMLKLAGMGGSGRPSMVVVGNDDEMMDEGILGDRTFNRVMPIVKRIASEVSDYDRDEFGEEMWSLLDQKYGSEFAQSVLQDDLDFYWNEYTELTGQGLDEERETEYANTPEEEYQTVASITRQGNDLNREKKQFAGKPRLGDNPMTEGEMEFDRDLVELLDSVLIKRDMEEGSIQGGKVPSDLTGTWSAEKPAKGKPDVPPPVPMDPVYPNAKDINKSEPRMKNMPLPKDAPEPRMKNMPLPKGTEPRTKPM